MKGEAFQIDTEFAAAKDKITYSALGEGLEGTEAHVQGEKAGIACDFDQVLSLSAVKSWSVLKAETFETETDFGADKDKFTPSALKVGLEVADSHVQGGKAFIGSV